MTYIMSNAFYANWFRYIGSIDKIYDDARFLQNITFSAEHKKLLDDFFVQMPDYYIPLFQARLFEGLTHKEIGQRFGISAQMSLVRINRLHWRKKYKDRFSALFPVSEDLQKQLRKVLQRWKHYYVRKEELDATTLETLGKEFPDLI